MYIQIESIIFGVPTGALGNGVAGVMAIKMGLPIQKLVLGTNENNNLTNFYNTGVSISLFAEFMFTIFY